MNILDVIDDFEADWNGYHLRHEHIMDWIAKLRAAAAPTTAAPAAASEPGLREALWTLTEHNALHFGESHNTVIQGRAALATPTASQAPAAGCEHDWRDFYTGPRRTHFICVKCDERRPAQGADAGEPVAIVTADRGVYSYGKETNLLKPGMLLYTHAQPAQVPSVDADPLQGAANWLVQAIVSCSAIDIARQLLIGHNRATRLFDAATQALDAGGKTA